MWGDLNGLWVSPETGDEIVGRVEALKERTGVAIRTMLKALGLSPSKFYHWKRRFGLPNRHNGRMPRDFWLEPWEVKAIVDYARRRPGVGYRYLTYEMLDNDVVAVSPATTYRVLKRHGLLNRWASPGKTGKRGFEQPKRPHEHWHIDISYVSIRGTFVFLIAVLDGYSRFVVHHELRVHMTERDVEIVLQRALERFPRARPRIISDNGSQFVSRDFKRFLALMQLQHVRTSPYHPQSNGKIEALAKTIKRDCIRVEPLFGLEDGRQKVGAFIHYYCYHRLHSAIWYLTPYEVLSGQAGKRLAERDRKLEEARRRRRERAAVDRV